MSGLASLPWWLRGKGIWYVGGMLSAVFLTMTLGFIAYEAREYSEDQDRQSQAQVKSLVAQTRQQLAGLNLALVGLAEVYSVMPVQDVRSRSGEALSKVKARWPEILELSLVDAKEGVLVDAKGQAGQPLPVILKEGLRTHRAAGILPWVYAGRTLQELGEPARAGAPFLLVAVAPFTSENRQFQLLATIDATSLGQRLEFGAQTNQAGAVWASHQADILAVTGGGRDAETNRWFRLLPALKPLILGRGGQDVSVEVRDLDGQLYWVTQRSFDDLPFTVLYFVSSTRYKDQVDDVAWGALMVTGVVCALILMLTWLTRRSLRSHESMSNRLSIAHDAMLASESRRLAVMDAALDAVVTIDESGCIVDFNQAAEDMFGHKASAVVGMPMHDVLIPESLREQHVKGMNRYARTGEGPVLGRRIEVEALHATGQTFPIELAIVPVTCAGHTYFTATIRDITTRKMVEREMHSLLKSYQEASIDLERQKLALDAHAIVSISDEKGQIVYANDKLARVSGYAIDELVGHSHSMLNSGTHSAEFFAEMWRTILSGAIWHGELVNRRRDGQLYWVSCSIVPVPDENDRPRQFIAIQTDISDRLQAETALKSAREREMAIGSRIQSSLLVMPPPSDVAGVWPAAFHQASQGIDGDFVEFIQMGDACVDILVGDVMGKGVPAALLGAATKLQFSRAIAELMAAMRHGQSLPTPADILARVHGTMTPHLQALDAFVTLAYIRLDQQANQIVWVGCGHEPSLLIQPDGICSELENQHPPLGVLEQVDYQQSSVAWHPGDHLFLSSDGVTDAILPGGERIGRVSLMVELLEQIGRRKPPAAALHRVRKALLHEGVSITDDVTMLLVAAQDPALPSKRLQIPCRHESLKDVRGFMDDVFMAFSVPEERAATVMVAVVEVVTNVVRHGKGLLDGAPIELIARREGRGLTLDVVNIGEHFQPPDVILEADLSEFPEGGFGLTIIRSACDEVRYLHDDGVNTVQMKIYL